MNSDKILRLPEVLAIAGTSAATISRQEKSGRFPKRRRIGIRAVGWLESEVQIWLQQRTQLKFHSHPNQQHGGKK